MSKISPKNLDFSFNIEENEDNLFLDVSLNLKKSKNRKANVNTIKTVDLKKTNKYKNKTKNKLL